jgi:amino acid adenylation domain-containing protein/non-ribosomal peptide synthase protein (TIGR01720 family)
MLSDEVAKSPLSFAQERLWFLEKYEEGTVTAAYNMSMVYRLSSRCELALLERSIRAIVDRHEILRTLIKEDNEGTGYQVVLADAELLLEINKVSVASQKQLGEEVKKEVNHIFNLADESPIRICLYELSMDRAEESNIAYYISIVVHHIAFDGWSADIFLKELQTYYNYYLKQKRGVAVQLALPALSIQYKDFALWQRNYLSGDRLDKQLGYWKNKLSGYESLNLLTDKPRPTQIDYTGADIYFELDKDTSMSLRALAKELKVSLYSVLLSGYYLMLRSYSNQDDIVVGTPIANRHYNQIEDLLGFFVNSLALRIQIDPTVTVKEFIEQVGEEVVEAQLHQDLPFEKLVEELKVAKDMSRHPIFQVMFSVQSFGGNVNSLTGETDEHNLTRLLTPYTPEDSLYQIAKFDISTFIDDGGEQLRGVFNYATSLYNESTIHGFVEVYVEILKQLGSLAGNVEKGKEIKIADLRYISEKQYELIINTWNATDKEYPSEKTIHELFEEQVEKTPDHIALVYEDVKLNYKELNARSNQLANYLRQTYDIKPDDLIALCLDRSEQMLIAILAVLKSGGAYVPMDPSYPDDRLVYLLGDTNAKVVLANEIYQARLAKISQAIGKEEIGIVSVDSKEIGDELLVQPIANPMTSTTSTSLAYVIYTSGTTGNPKGVMIEHKGVVNLKYDLTSRYELDSKNNNEVLLQFANYVFDASVEQIILSLLNGHTLVMLPHLLWLDKSRFYQYLNRNKVTYIEATPTFLEQFDFVEVLSLRRIVFGGEKLNKSCYDNISVPNNCKKINTYGPTEISITASVNHNIEGNNLSIGNPISNAKCYVLDSNFQLLPIGAIGELYIGGMGLARGYLNRHELTRERFIVNPFQTEQEKQDKRYGASGRNARLYKTGDLVRWLPDGNLEYIGRNDFQVKIRGYRIELGEIESVLLSYAGIKQAVVLAKEHKMVGTDDASSGSKYLVGYYVSDNKLDETVLLSYLQSKLPEYMVPSAFVHVEQLPLTINGKLDRKALPDPEFTNSDHYVAPRNELEGMLCQIWTDVLRLPVEQVGIEDDFFRLGGNSILAIKLVSRLSKEFNKRIHVATIFKHSTVSKFVDYLKHNEEEEVVIEKTTVIHPEKQWLSFAQERLWFLEKYEEGTAAYNIPLVYRLSSECERDLLERSIRAIVDRHEILRTLIKEDTEGTGYQVVLADAELLLTINRVSVASQKQLDEELKKEVNHIFNLVDEYPIRICLYELSVDEADKNNIEHYISIVVHHIAFDGWSVDIFLKELQTYYNYYLKQKRGIVSQLGLPALTIQYKDFALWQRNYLSGAVLYKQLAYWKNKLSGYESLNLITDQPRPSQIDYTGSNIYFELDKATSMALRALAKQLKVSLYSVLLSGYYLMLRSYSNQDDIVVGTPIANRHYSQIEDLLGFFVNSLALRIQIEPTIRIKEFIEQVGEEVVEAQLHQDLPFEKLVEELKIAKDTSRHPIFQVMFSVQSFGGNLEPVTSETEEHNLAELLQGYTPGNSLYQVAKFDLSTFIEDGGEKLEGVFNYATSLYNEATIHGFIEIYLGILKQIGSLVDNAEQGKEIKITDLRYISEKQYELLINTWNATDKEYPSEKTIHELFEEQVERTPDNIALVYEDVKLTYKELNARSNQLANYLRQTYDIKPDDLIALCLDRSEQMLIAILAVLKSGGAYVPMDPSYPDDRVAYLLADINAKVLLANGIYQARLEKVNQAIGKEEIGIVAVDGKEILEELLVQPATNPMTATTSTSLAYVIYTSGTTGNPKGVMIEHKGVVSLVKGVDYVHIGTNDCFIQLADIAFDAATFEIWGGLLNGARLFIPSDRTSLFADMSLFKHTIITNGISVLWLTKALFDQLFLLDQSVFKEIKYLLVGGEALNQELMLRLINSASAPQNVINGYGPTENTTFSCSFNLSKESTVCADSIPIGKPLSSRKAYVLDSRLQPLPIGAVGELYIGGVGLSRGYLNRPELTKERFIVNPFQTEQEKQDKSYGESGRNARLYKTGDLVRWLPDGNLEYIGRNDFQVKIRGYRIELGEIEAVLSTYPEVRQSVVLAKEHKSIGTDESSSGSKYLVGYYVSDNKLDESMLLSYLQNKLPEYMVPSTLVHLVKLPLTINGKLDRKTLPDPAFTNSNHYVAPRNELETKICQIWANVVGLPVEQLGITDDFFRLGGDSIISVQLVSRLRQKLGIQVSVKDIFSYKTIAKLYDQVLSKQLASKHTLTLQTEQGRLIGEVELLPIQAWFFENNFAKASHWNQSFITKTPSLELTKLKASIASLVAHHDSFRLRYKKSQDNSYVQYYDSNAQVTELKILDIRTLNKKEGSKEFNSALEKVLTDWQSNFNLEQGPIYSIGYIHGYADGSSRIFFAFHHLIVDVASWRILVEDLKSLYEGNELGAKGTSYRQWVTTVREYADNHKNEKNYWVNALSDYDDINNLLPNMVGGKSTSNYANFNLSKEQTKNLLQGANRAYNTQTNDILLTALGYTLHEVTNNKINHIVLEGHGREEIDDSVDVSRALGWFTTMYPVRLELSTELGSSIKNIKESLRQVPNKGIGYGALIGYESNKLPRISFNYLGQFDQADKNQKAQAQNNFWNIVNEGSGISMHSDNQDYNIVDINGMVINGELNFNITSKLDKSTTTQLAEVFKQKLEEIVAHCMANKVSEFTMSDCMDFQPYIIYNEAVKGNNNRLFLLPPGDGGAESYISTIVPQLPEKNLVLFNNYYLYLENKFGASHIHDVTFEKLAEEYIRLIKSIQPKGPYNLFGWSFGGVLAFEIGKQLLDTGDVVENIVMIDSVLKPKKTLLETNTEDNIYNIYDKYSPCLNLTAKMSEVNVVLFKALKVKEKYNASEDMLEAYRYSVDNVKCNNWSEILPDKNFEIINMDDNHFDWIKNETQVIEICKVLK